MALRTSTLWKLLGLAGVVGVAATGAITLRNERRRRDYSPEEIRSVLHERYARAVAARDGTEEVPLTEVPMSAKTRIRRLLRRVRSRR
ncbi:hypothetical protein EV641_101285 [Rhodococcus sp. SMB37]|uniref:hypothetical protein n=1 Tax=Rhodococcus sp. SMB37 TaxID=2512213 RepID=UPI00104FB18C|nr:hypothetical protein [Rhodococcus sp. SMB37]TCN58183.1 hypothetical protein EV641_101285 [Rhodococcus sp. SMB37]